MIEIYVFSVCWVMSGVVDHCQLVQRYPTEEGCLRQARSHRDDIMNGGYNIKFVCAKRTITPVEPWRLVQ